MRRLEHPESLKNVQGERFWLFLVPCWVLATFFLVVFLKNSGWLPETPATIYDLAYLLAALLLFLLPFVSRIKLGQLFELERKVEEAREEVKYFKNEVRQMFAASSASANSTLNVTYAEGQLSMEELKDAKLGKPRRTVVEYKILNTLWNRQVLKFPDLIPRFTFRLNESHQDFLLFREAGNRLLGEGLIGETEIGQFYLSEKGLTYCAEEYANFPDDMYFQHVPLNEPHLRQILENLQKMKAKPSASASSDCS
jgi:hypothetical protein